MTVYGLTPTGFEAKPTTVILEEMIADCRGSVDENFDADAETAQGQILATCAAQIGELWALGKALDVAYNPDDAEDYAHETVAALVGVVRFPATRTRIPSVNVVLSAGATLPANSIANLTGNPAVQAFSESNVTNTSGIEATLTVDFLAVATGPTIINAGTLTEITTPVTGWVSLTNPTDGALGRDIETDAELRFRRDESLSRIGGATVDAIRADVLAINGVIACTVRDNKTDALDLQGLPPHSIETIVYHDGTVTDEQIAQAIWDTAPGGATLYGNSAGQAVDSEGVTHDVVFSVPIPQYVYVTLYVSYDEDDYVGDAELKELFVAAATTRYRPGRDVIAAYLRKIAFVAGVEDVYEVRLKIGSAPASFDLGNLGITADRIAIFDVANVTVVSTVYMETL
jgi:uncharacterized phage protein gp47/JayE